jgi:nitrate reductase gamma subunit
MEKLDSLQFKTRWSDFCDFIFRLEFLLAWFLVALFPFSMLQIALSFRFPHFASLVDFDLIQ